MKKVKNAKIPGLKHTWSEIERRKIAGTVYALIECDNPEVKRLKVIDEDMNIIVRDAFEDELDELLHNAASEMRDPYFCWAD